MTSELRNENQLIGKVSAPMGACDWGEPAYLWLAISNYSPLKEHWWVRGIDFPYEIVLLPGYKRPAALKIDDIDAIWYEGEITEPLVIWDGEFSDNLFEMISMCMDPAAEMVDYIRVRRTGSSTFMEDPRPLEMLKARPQRTFEGELVSYHRSVNRDKFVAGIQRYYREWQHKTRAWSMSGGMSICYDERNRKSLRHPRVHWEMLVNRHPDVDEKFLFSESQEKPPGIPGLKFGYDLFKEEMAKHPEWMPKQLELDYLIDIDEEFVRTPYQQVSFKQTRDIPLTKEDEKILKKGGDYATPGVRSFLNKFHASLRRG